MQQSLPQIRSCCSSSYTSLEKSNLISTGSLCSLYQLGQLQHSVSFSLLGVFPPPRYYSPVEFGHWLSQPHLLSAPWPPAAPPLSQEA